MVRLSWRVLFSVAVQVIAGSGIAALLALMLAPDVAELGVRDKYFAGTVLWLGGAALLTLFVLPCRFRFGFTDVVLLLLALYVSFNCYFISPIPASAQYIRFFYWTAGIFSLRVILSTYRHLIRGIFVGILTVGLIEAGMGLGQVLGLSASNNRLFAITGSFLNPGPYGGFLAVVLAMAIGYIVCRYRGSIHGPDAGGGWKRFVKPHGTGIYVLCWLVIGLSLTVFLATKSRAAWVALTVAIFVLILGLPAVRNGFRKWKNRHKWRVVYGCAVFVILLSLCGTGLYFLKPASADGRMLMWNVSTRMIAKTPVCGAGYGAFGGAYGRVQAEYFATHPDSPFVQVAGAPQYAFNEYLQLGAETGLVGLALMLVLLLVTLRRLLVVWSPFGYSLLTLLIFALFSYPFQLLPFRILLMFLIAIAGCMGYRTMGVSFPTRVTAGLVLGVFTAGCMSCLVLYFEKIDATARWMRERLRYEYGYYTDVAGSYAVLLPSIGDNPSFLFEYGHSLYKVEEYLRSNVILQRGANLSGDPMYYNIMGNNYKALKDYSAAERAYQEAYNRIPNRIYPLYLLTELYAGSGQRQKMVQMGHRVLDFEEKVPSAAGREIKAEVAKLLE